MNADDGRCDAVRDSSPCCYTGVVYVVGLRGRGIVECVLPAARSCRSTSRWSRPVRSSPCAAGPTPRVSPAPRRCCDWTEFLARAPSGHVVMMQRSRDDDRAP